MPYTAGRDRLLPLFGRRSKYTPGRGFAKHLELTRLPAGFYLAAPEGEHACLARTGVPGLTKAAKVHPIGSPPIQRMWPDVKPLLTILALALALSSNWPGHGSVGLERTGDVLQIALPVGAGLSALILQDWMGFGRLAALMLVSQGATHLLKHAIESRRPDGGSNGFPSGHTSAAFAGSGFVAFRYGNRYAWPLHLAAAVVGYSRLTADKHGLMDVAGGATLSLLSCWGLVRRRRSPGGRSRFSLRTSD